MSSNHMANLSLFSAILLLIINPYQATQPKNQTRHNGFSLRMIHRDSIKAHLNQTMEENIDNLINLSMARAHFLERDGRDNSSSVHYQVARPSLHLESGQGLFHVQIGIGTFPAEAQSFKTYYLDLDTAGSNIWTQCERCDPCFEQRDPLFPWSKSTSYYIPLCDVCPPNTVCMQGHCMFQTRYGDGSHVFGIKATETFTFATDTGHLQTITGLGFGCVTQAFDFVISEAKKSSGVFSYCLIPTEYQGEYSSMFLRFGDDIPPLNSIRPQRTPLIRGSRPYYYVNLQGVSVSSTRLSMKTSVFRLTARGSKGGCLIDTGTSVTHLINVAYAELAKVLIRKVESRNPEITIISHEPKLCFRQPRGTKSMFPKLTFHFENDANLVIGQEAYMSAFIKGNYKFYCLMIIPNDSQTIIGASQQVNYRFIYDTVGDELQFASTNCLSSN